MQVGLCSTSQGSSLVFAMPQKGSNSVCAMPQKTLTCSPLARNRRDSVHSMSSRDLRTHQRLDSMLCMPRRPVFLGIRRSIQL